MDTEEEKLAELKAALSNYQPAKQPEANTFASLWHTDSIDWNSLQSMQIPALTTSQITTIDFSQLTQNTVLGGSGGSGGGGGSGIVYTTPVVGGGAGSHSNTTISGAHHTWTTTGTGTGYNWPNQGVMQVHAQDLEINGKSVMKSLERIEAQLGLLDSDEKLEADWKELRDLGNKYRRVQKRIQDKLATFNKLKETNKKVPS
jgi:hypothetical protein